MLPFAYGGPSCKMKVFCPFGSTNNPVQILFIPTLQHAGLALGEIAAHREPCFRQVQGILVVTIRFSVPFSAIEIKPVSVARRTSGPSPHHWRFAASGNRAKQTVVHCAFCAQHHLNMAPVKIHCDIQQMHFQLLAHAGDGRARTDIGHAPAAAAPCRTLLPHTPLSPALPDA